jgi:hypothetical protein
MTDEARPIPPELVAEAKKFPGGWVYEIGEGVDPAGEVPPELIRGAWAVDAAGELTGEYRPNPRYTGRTS